MPSQSDKNTFKIDISKNQPDEKQTPVTDPKVEKTDLTVHELEERIAPLRL